jgi:hypothetical protein
LWTSEQMPESWDRLKGTVQRDFWPPVFSMKWLIMMPIDTPKSDFEFCRIFVVIRIQNSKNGLPTIIKSGESKIEPSVTPIFDFFQWPFKGKGSPSKLVKKTPRCHQWIPAMNGVGSMTLRSKQSEEYRHPAWNGRPEFLQKIQTFVTPRCEREVATLCSKQYGEYQLSAINNSGESINNREYFLQFEARFEKLWDTE